MADYWKSQERKYCDFCKCWITDNKPSVDFHEKGRRHKENVAKRLRFIQKKSRYDERESLKVDAALQKMESAALEAYRKDVKSNADLTSIAINKKITGTNKLWQETKSPDGKIYYWNTSTNETLWQPPSEGYLSLTEQKEITNETSRQQFKAAYKHDMLQDRLRAQEDRKQREEERAKLAREKLKERRVEELPPVLPAPIIPSKSTPYGVWQTIRESEPTMDLQLPSQEEQQIELPAFEEEPKREPPPKEFKEKVVESLGSGSIGFKKRKFGRGTQRNTRQRLDDDDL